MINKNKISVNVICLIILAVILFSVGISLGRFTQGMIDGWTSVSENSGEYLYATGYFTPRAGLLSEATDSIPAVDGSKLPIVIEKAHVAVNSEQVSISAAISIFFLNIGCVILSLTIMVMFVKFIVRINRMEIFIEHNARTLRNIGILLLAVALLSTASQYVEHVTMLDKLPAVRDYTHSFLPSISWTNIVIGLLSLLMSQIWELGLKMKQENDLTV